MRPVFQDIFGSPQMPHRGNCFQAAIASMLELGLDEVPPFHEYFNNPAKNWYFAILLPFCLEQGYHYVRYPYNDDYIETEYYFVSGKSPNVIGASHITIWKNGEMVHDPNPSGKGVLIMDELSMLIPRICTGNPEGVCKANFLVGVMRC